MVEQRLSRGLEILDELMSPADDDDDAARRELQDERDASYLFAEQLMAPYLEDGLNPFK